MKAKQQHTNIALAQSQFIKKATRLAGIFSLIFVAIAAIGSVFLQKALRQSQDVRREAWVDDGQVTITTSLPSGSVFTKGQELVLDLKINTGGTSVDGWQLFTELIGEQAINDTNEQPMFEQINIEILDVPGMKTISSGVQQAFCADCFSITTILLTQDPTQPFSTHNEPVSFVRLRLVPQTTGTFQLGFSDSQSFSIDRETNQDELAIPGRFTFTVVDDEERAENPVSWQTEHTYLIADDFYIEANGQKFYGTDVDLLVHSDPPNPPSTNYTTLEASWTENGVEMRYYLYFRINDEKKWYIDEMRTYNGNSSGDWIYYTNHGWQLSDPLLIGEEINRPGETTLTTSENGIGKLYFKNLRLKAFTQGQEIEQCPAPQNLTVSSSSCKVDGSLDFTIDWDDLSGVSQYETNLSNNPDFDLDTTTFPTDSQWSYYQLQSGHWYAKVRASHAESCQPTNNWSQIEYNETCEIIPQCHYQYEAWDECINGWQSRSYSTQPDGCGWHEDEVLEELVQYCGDDEVTELPITLYTYETCWHGDSSGISTYVIWDDKQFADVSWIDISEYSDFREFAHKNVHNATEPYYDKVVTNGLGFVWNKDNRDPFYFSPDKTYYLRLFNGSHSPVTTFYMPQCEGYGGISYKQCNESCDNNRECAANLTCYQNQCRFVTNLESDICALPPDQGLNRDCNEYCADNRECAAGYSCSWNRCRNPNNPENIDCHEPITTTYTSGQTVITTTTAEYIVPQYCNEYCNYNRDCAPNYRCYNNQCRLADNPESSICSLESVGDTDEEKEVEPTPEPTDAIDSTGLDDDEEESTIAALLEPSPTTYFKTSEIEIKDQSQDKPVEEQTAFDAFKEYLAARGISSPWSIVLIGLGVFGVFLLISVLGRSKAITPKMSITEKDALKPPAHPIIKPTTPVTTTRPVASALPKTLTKPPAKIPMVKPITPDKPTPKLTSSPSPTTAPTQKSFGKQIKTKVPLSTMVRRIKQKNIKPPGSSRDQK